MSSLNGWYAKNKTGPEPASYSRAAGVRTDTICTRGWTKDREERLARRWADGASASQIADELGGTTRNAVIGKVHRMGLSDHAAFPDRARPESKHRTYRKSKKLKGKRKPWTYGPKKAQSNAGTVFEASPLPPALESDIPRKTIEQLEDDWSECRFPVTLPNGRHMFCADTAVPGAPHPYCYAHLRRCTQAPIPRRDAPAQPEAPKPVETPDEMLIEA